MAPFWCFGSIIGYLQLVIGVKTVHFVNCATSPNNCPNHPGGTLGMAKRANLILEFALENTLNSHFSLKQPKTGVISITNIMPLEQ